MAGQIPQEIIEQVMQRADIVEVVGEYVSLKKRGRNWFGLCPFHNEDTASFSVNEDKQIFKCFGCGKGGNVVGFIQEIEHLNFGEAVRKLADRYQIEIPERALSQAEQQRHSERQAMLAAHREASAFYAAALPASRQAQAYLLKRGLDADSARRFGLGAAPDADWQALSDRLSQAGYSQELLIKCGLVSRSAKNGRCYDKFHGRLIFPIRDHRGAVVAFGGRAMGDDEPKYLNSQTTPIYNKSNLLYALDLAADSIRRLGQAVIMEGYIDVVTAHATGVTNAVACLGTAFTGEHARLLRRYAPEPPAKLVVILAFDGDAAGHKAARLSLDKLAAFDFIEARVMSFPDGLDPDDFLRRYGLRGWQRLLDKYCLPALNYLLQQALARQDISTAAGKGAVVAELAPAVRRCHNQTERASFLTELSRTLHVSEEAIRADLLQGHSAGGTERRGPAPTPPARRFTAGRPANRQLLLLALQDKNIFQLAKAELGENFPSTEEEAQLIDFISGLGERYDFHPASLFNELDEEKEGLRQFLLKLLQAEMAQVDNPAPAEEYIRVIRRQQISEELALLQRRIKQAEDGHEDVAALIQEKTRLTLLAQRLS